MNKQIKTYLIITAVIIAITLGIYYFGKKAGAYVGLPDGVSIPTGWSAVPSAEALFAAMDGFGTDTTAIWNTLEGLNTAQLAAIYNEYLHRFNVTLFDDFRGDLSGDDLRRALNYFSFMS